MNPLEMWFVGYAMPALTAGTLIKFLWSKSVKTQIIVIHIALVISILMSHYFIWKTELLFPYLHNIWSVLLYGASTLFASFLLGKSGVWYGLSSLLQQFTIFSAAFLLFPNFSNIIVILLIVPIYVYCHYFHEDYSYVRILLFSIWGVVSVLLLSATQDFYLLAAFHTCLGSVLTKEGVINPRLQDKL